MTNWSPYLQIAREAATAAAEPIRHYFQGNFEVETKADATPVTVADREAERRIREVIGNAFPDHGLYGEELGKTGHEKEFVWLIDPIDGTKSFVQGYGMFSTQLALMHEGRIVVGVSSAPAMDETAWATRGGGAFLDGRPLQISHHESVAGASISTGNIGSLARSRTWGRLGELLAVAGRTRGYGDFYHYHRLAGGQLDAVLESDVNILDIAALSLIVEEAGGVFTDLTGHPIDLGTTSVLAANSVLHDALLNMFGDWKNE